MQTFMDELIAKFRLPERTAKICMCVHGMLVKIHSSTLASRATKACKNSLISFLFS